MTSQHIGINEARPKLGDLVTAVQQGADVVLTRNGKPVARLVRYQEAIVTISYARHRPADAPTEEAPFAGSFNQRAATYWMGDGKPRLVEVGGEEVYESREGERLWRADNDGRWIVTQLGDSDLNNYLVSNDEAEQWFNDNGYGSDRESFALRLSD